MINRIEKIRKKKKLSQTEICKSLKISKKTYYNYIHKNIIPSNVLIDLSNIFECTTDYLLGVSNYTAIVVTNADSDVLAVIDKDKVIEHSDCKVIFSED